MRDHQPPITVPAAAAWGTAALADAPARRPLYKRCGNGSSGGNGGVWPTAEE